MGCDIWISGSQPNIELKEKKEISKYCDGRITGVGESWEGMWFDNLNEDTSSSYCYKC